MAKHGRVFSISATFGLALVVLLCCSVEGTRQGQVQGWGSYFGSAPRTFLGYVKGLVTQRDDSAVSEFQMTKNITRIKMTHYLSRTDVEETLPPTAAPSDEMDNGYMVTSNYDAAMAVTESYDDFLMGSEEEQKILKRVLRQATDTSTPAPGANVVSPGSEAMFSYGVSAGDTLVPKTANGCVKVALPVKIRVRTSRFAYIYICMNGFIALNQPDTDGTTPTAGQESAAVRALYKVAPYWTNLGPATRGIVSYRILTDLSANSDAFNSALTLVDESASDLRQSDRNIREIIVATWAGVGHTDAANDASQIATFQVIIIATGARTFAIFNYLSNGMNILIGDVFIGYTLTTDYFRRENNTVDGSFLRAADSNLSHKERPGYLFYEITANAEYQATDRCEDIYGVELEKLTTYTSYLTTIPNCPCTVTLLKISPFFSVSSTTSLPSSGTFCTPTTNMYTDGSAVICCYDMSQGTIITSGPSAGHFVTHHPTLQTALYEEFDKDFKDLCCVQSSAQYCDKFYEVRPQELCNPDCPTGNAGAFGDPHLSTLDGFSYTFNGLGEYDLIVTSDFTLQARTEQATKADGTLIKATLFSSFAAEDKSGASILVEQNYEKNGMVVFANGVDYTSRFYDVNIAFEVIITNQLELSRLNGAIRIGFTTTGFLMRVTQGAGMLSIQLFVPKTFNGLTSGLLGNFDGNTDNDMIKRGETNAISQTSTDVEIFQFGETWRTAASTSKFLYRNGNTWTSYTDLDFLPKFVSEYTQEQLNSTLTVCGGLTNTACVFDFLATDDVSVADNTKEAVTTVNLDTAVSTNVIPSIEVVSGLTSTSIGYSVQVTQGLETTFTIKAVDDGTPALEFATNTVGATFGAAAQDGSQIVTFTLTSTDVKVLSIVAKDNNDVLSPSLDVIILFCTGCNSQGTCDFNNLQVDSSETSFFFYSTCDCNDYYSGTNCDTNFDACTVNPCSSIRTCTDKTPAEHEAGVAFECGPCPPGYTESNGECFDVDECTGGTHTCSQVGLCTNTVGSFRCSCNAGYRLSGTELCLDLNECDEGTSGCPQLCTNTAGSFTCECNPGYKYDAGSNACNIDPDATQCTPATCSNAAGCSRDVISLIETCFCNKGYSLTGTNTCTNINECSDSHNFCSQTCSDTEGSYKCSCLIGYKLATDKITCEECPYPGYGVDCLGDCRTCGPHADTCDRVRGCVCQTGWQGSACTVDIDECSAGTPCSTLEVCANTDGSYRCDCSAGFSRAADETCQDIDECLTTASDICQQTCINSIGSFSCACFSGFVQDPTSPNQCLDIDECTIGTSGCQQICNNVAGSANCDCNFGYRLTSDRKTCALVADVCASFSGLNCGQLCVVVGQTASCKCNSGYQLAADMQTCNDIDECDSSLGLNGCSDTSSCVNTDGSYQCSCTIGSKLENDMRTCKVCDDGFYGQNCASQCQCGAGALRCDSVAGCVCKPNLSGDNCDVDINECASATNPCTGANTQCINLFGSYSCQCITGYARDDVTNICQDVDECSDASLNECEQTCTNNAGSYTCSCAGGFTQSGNTCTNIDECAGVHGCSETCTDTIGGYRCSCSEGYRLNPDDLQTCLPDTICVPLEAATCGANTDCANIGGTATCTCKAGFQDDVTTPNTCKDILECGQQNPTVCSDVCVETAGGFTCSCTSFDGFKLSQDNRGCVACDAWTYGTECVSACTCDQTNSESCNVGTGKCSCKSGWNGTNCDTDIDECLDSTKCQDNAACANSPGSFTCTCNIGFSQAANGTCLPCDGKTTFGVACGSACQCLVSNTQTCDTVNGTCTCLPGYEGTQCESDINECAADPCGAARFKVCNNIPGSYRCICRDGFSLDANGDCQDIDECTLGLSDCEQVCTNTVGAFTCSCRSGYTGDRTCTDVDECASNTLNQCSVSNSCVNSVGDYVCSCNQGYQLGSDARTCQDIDECTQTTDNCQQNCTNTDGSFECSCFLGYSGTATCVVCTHAVWGMNCVNACDCEDGHTSTGRVCNAFTGQCICATAWTGTRCETDVDECALDTDGCLATEFKGCRNTAGSFECACLLGYENAAGETCVLSTTTTTPVTPAATKTASALTMALDYTVPAGTELNVALTHAEYQAELDTQLTALYSAAMGTEFSDVIVTSVGGPNLEVNYSVVMDDSDVAASEFAEITKNLASQSRSVTVFGQASKVTALAINAIEAPIGPAADADALRCLFFTETISSCDTGYTCAVRDGLAYCQKDAEQDNLPLILGLGVGLPLFFLLVAIIIVVACLMRKKRSRSKRGGELRDYTSSMSSEQGIFAHVIPKAYNHRRHMQGHGNTFARSEDWDDGSETSDDVRRQRDPRDDYRRHQNDQSRPSGPSYIYDNPARKSNFSWDFLYRNGAPNEEYRIQRPHVSQTPRYW